MGDNGLFCWCRQNVTTTNARRLRYVYAGMNEWKSNARAWHTGRSW